jgi:hypothetical protein
MTEALLQEMHWVVTASGAQFLAFHIPFRGSIYPADWTALEAQYGLLAEEWELQQVQRNFLASCKESMACLDPTARFLEAAETLNKEGERLYYRYDHHWNARGHFLAAEILADYVLTHLFTPEHTERDTARLAAE